MAAKPKPNRLRLKGIKLVEISKIDVPEAVKATGDLANASWIAATLQNGTIFNPIPIRPGDQIGRYEAIAGYDRLVASSLANKTTIRCRIVDATDDQAELLRLEDNLMRKNIRVLAKAEMLSRWVEIAAEKAGFSEQDVPKKKGRPRTSIVSFVVDHYPPHDTTPDARKEQIKRAIKIASIEPEAKIAAKAAGLDDNQAALLEIASLGDLDEQLRCVARLNQPEPSSEENPPETENPSPPAEAGRSDETITEEPEKRAATSLSTFLSDWKKSMAAKWTYLSVPDRHRFIQAIMKKRCKVEGDYLEFIRAVFLGKKQLEASQLSEWASKIGLNYAKVRQTMKANGYKFKKTGQGSDARSNWLNADPDWKEKLPNPEYHSKSSVGDIHIDYYGV